MGDDLASTGLTVPPLVTFVIPGEPIAKGRHRASVRNGKVMTYPDAKTRQGEQDVAVLYLWARGAARRNDECGFTVCLDFHVGRRQRRDIDNCVKLVLDGLNGVAWRDDSQVTELHAKMYHGAVKPYTLVMVEGNHDLPLPAPQRRRVSQGNAR